MRQEEEEKKTNKKTKKNIYQCVGGVFVLTIAGVLHPLLSRNVAKEIPSYY